MFKVGWSSLYNHTVPESHRFPMEKYDLLLEQLLYEEIINEENVFEPAQLSDEKVLITHTREYLNKLKSLRLTKIEERRTGFKLTADLIKRELHIMDGTIRSAIFALKHGVSFNIAGGTHHAFTSKGEGFCLLNDFAIASNYLLQRSLVNSVLIIDLDVHQGNGTAEIFHNTKEVYTFSVHGKNNFPLHKEKSDLDIEVEDGCSDQEYLAIINNYVPKIVKSQQPDIIFYQCGVDILDSDKLGRLSITKDGCKERDRIVLETACENNIPLCGSVGGGYSENIRDIVDAHTNTFRLAKEIFF